MLAGQRAVFLLGSGASFTIMVNDRSGHSMRRLTISLDDQDYRQISLLAEAEERSLNWVICRAVKEYLERHGIAEQLGLSLREARS